MNAVTFEHGRDRPPTTGELEAQARRGRWLAVFPDGRRFVGRNIVEEIVARVGMRWYAIVDRGDEYETIAWPLAPKADLDAIELQAKRDGEFCGMCGSAAVKVCDNPKCGIRRCITHTDRYIGGCEHNWRRPAGAPEEVLALVDELRDAYSAFRGVLIPSVCGEVDGVQEVRT